MKLFNIKFVKKIKKQYILLIMILFNLMIYKMLMFLEDMNHHICLIWDRDLKYLTIILLLLMEMEHI
jgi:hypothetical protein